MEEETKETTYTKKQIEEYRKKVQVFYTTNPTKNQINVFFKRNTIINDIIEFCAPLEIKNYQNKTKRYWFIHNISTFPKCSAPNCNNFVKREVINTKVGYSVQSDKEHVYCCGKCQKTSPHYIATQRAAIIRNFGKINKKQIYPSNIKSFKEKIKYSRRFKTYNKMLTNKFVIPNFTFDEFFKYDGHIKTAKFQWKCLECGNIFYTTYQTKDQYIKSKYNKDVNARCPYCYPRCNTASLEEKHIYQYLKKKYPFAEIFNNNVENWKIISPYQIDIIIKVNRKIILCIEYNGSRWHSIQNGVTLNKQLNKTILCENLGIPLIHIYDDEWRNLNTNRKIKKLIDQIICNGNELQFNNANQQIILSRDKFSKAITIKNYILVKELPPKIIKRYSNFQEMELYDVPNAGYLIYQKLKDVR